MPVLAHIYCTVTTPRAGFDIARSQRGYASHRTPLQRLYTLRCSLLYLRTYSVCRQLRPQGLILLPSGVTARLFWVLPHRKVLMAATYLPQKLTHLSGYDISSKSCGRAPYEFLASIDILLFSFAGNHSRPNNTPPVFGVKTYLSYHCWRISSTCSSTY